MSRHVKDVVLYHVVSKIWGSDGLTTRNTKAVASRLEAISIRLEAVALGMEAIDIRFLMLLGCRPFQKKQKPLSCVLTARQLRFLVWPFPRNHR